MGANSRWMLIGAALVIVELVAASLIGVFVGFPYQLAIAAHIVAGFAAASICILAVFIGLLARNAYRGADRALDGIFSPGIVRYSGQLAAGILLIALQMCVLQWTKSMIPHVTTMWADPMLARFDRALFLGTDPWRLTHAVFGRANWIDSAYMAWGPIKFATLLLLLFLPISAAKDRALAAYFLIFAIGCLLQYALPSGGPIFFERLGHGSDFHDLPVPHFAAEAANYLWANYRGSGIVGTGISAMPSIHVAIALWLALTWRSFGLGYLGFVFYAVILVGSVHTGFHYALDGIVGSIMAAAAWLLVCQKRPWEKRNWQSGRLPKNPGAVGVTP